MNAPMELTGSMLRAAAAVLNGSSLDIAAL